MNTTHFSNLNWNAHTRFPCTIRRGFFAIDARHVHTLRVSKRSSKGPEILFWYRVTTAGEQVMAMFHVLVNILLDGLDKELERRGHRFVRYVDDCNISVVARSNSRLRSFAI